jgi:uncharacterized protein YigE (DUF2233 family)
MKKKLLLFLGFVFIFSFVFYLKGFYFIKNKNTLPVGEKTLGAKEESVSFLTVKAPSGDYNFDYFEADSRRLFLFSNFDEGEKTDFIKEKFECKYLSSAGFYNEDFKPIGLFISEYQENSSWGKNNIFNAIFSINDFDTPRITRNLPSDRLRLALQSGPIVFENGSKVIFKSSASFERRVVLGVTGDNKPIFFVFWSFDNFFKGPSLEDLPHIIEYINNNFNLNIADAINLDGGTASSFYGPHVILKEVSKVGGFFCLK